MAEALAAFARTRNDLDAVVGIGGGGGTSIVTAGMRELPFGVPKLMVSTLASGDVGPYVGVSDITMMHAGRRHGRAQPHHPLRPLPGRAAIIAMAGVAPATTTSPPSA